MLRTSGMKVFSFAQDGNEMVTVEVELSLIPGLPQVQITGLPDPVIKESIMRIKSAVQAQGFEWPKTRQMIINLRPAYLKKNSRGTDLAIATALLLKTRQIRFPDSLKQPLYAYGELSLTGEVSLPNGWQMLPPKKEGLLTGTLPGGEDNYLCPLFQIKTLKDITHPVRKDPKPLTDLMEKPPLPSVLFSQKAAQILTWVAAGEHSLLLAGEAGSGKTTLAENLFHLLTPPSLKSFSEARKIHLSAGQLLKYRPFRTPHHSTTPLSMIGGGWPLFFGEITRAHSGMLFMDEYLEFHPRVQEALREPMEKSEIHISRKGQGKMYPADFLLVAATNLCPCGDLIPGQSSRCSYSLRRCFSHLDRLNGPMLDRFDMMAFSTQWKGDFLVPLKTIHHQVLKARRFCKSRGQSLPNGKLSLQELESNLDPFVKESQLASFVSSHRRRRALLRVGRTLADLQESPHIKASHLGEAKEFAFLPFEKMKNRAEFP